MAAIVAVVAIVLAALLLVPVTQSFSMTLVSPNSPAGVTEKRSFPSGSDVKGSWSTGCTSSMGFVIWDGGDSPAVYSSPTGSTSGQFSFTSDGQGYTFHFSCLGPNPELNISGTFTGPIL